MLTLLYSDLVCQLSLQERYNKGNLKPPCCEMIGQAGLTIDHHAAAAFQPR